MHTKDSSVECHFVPELTELLFDIDKEYRRLGSEVVITSGSELYAAHMETSLHFSGQAADLRIWNVDRTPAELLESIATVALVFCKKKKIPSNWVDVVLEKDHIHIEYQPKRIR